MKLSPLPVLTQLILITLQSLQKENQGPSAYRWSSTQTSHQSLILQSMDLFQAEKQQDSQW